MLRKSPLLLFALLFAGSFLLWGCDTTANREIARAEKALDEALEVNADAYATEDYNAATELFQDATALAADKRIQEARTAAIKAKIRAEDAKKKAEERHKILEGEMERIGR